MRGMETQGMGHGGGIRGTVVAGVDRLAGVVERERATRGSTWRLVFFLAGTLVLVVGGGSLLKLWRVTPKGFSPVVRVSLLDWMQARALGKAAREHTTAGRWREAAFSWRGAVANNPADLGLLRGVVEAATMEGSRLVEEGGVPLNQAAWLLRLGRTNAVDVDLVVRLLARLEMRDSILQLGLPVAGQLSREGALELVRAMFDAGDLRGFDALWRAREAEFAGHPELALYRSAWKAQWGPPGTMREGMEALEKGMKVRPLRRLALQLSGRIAGARADLAEHRRLLDLMEVERLAGIADHVAHWRLLVANGRRDEARRLAAASELTPGKLGEMHQLVDALLGLGLAEEAMSVVDKRPPSMRQDPRLVVLTVRCLEALGRWEEVRELALAVRRDPALLRIMEGCSYALEAIASRKLGLAEDARAAAVKAASAHPGEPAIAMATATRLSEAGFPDSALAMFRAVEDGLGGVLSYWLQRLQVATVLGDVAEIVVATEKALALEPGDMRNVHNRASALILARLNPAEAVQLTLRNVTAMPGQVDFQINHALALAMNDMATEAAGVLGRLDERALTEVQRTNYRVAWFDVCVRRSDWSGARRWYGAIERAGLQRLQLDRLDREFKALPPT